MSLRINAKRLLHAIRARSGPYGGHVAVLITGAGLAQLVPALTYPLLARLYTPSEYGAVSILASIGAVLAVVAAGRYQMATMLPLEESDATRITTLALAITVAFTGLVAISVAFLHDDLGKSDEMRQLGIWLLVLPIIVLLTSMFDVLSYFAIRRDRYSEVTRASIAKSLVSSGAQVGLGFAGTGIAGLVVSNILSLAAANSRLIGAYRSAASAIRLDVSRIRHLCFEYINFPKYDLWSSLANALSYNITIFGIGVLYSTTVVGHYALAYRIVALPSTLIGAAIGQVYLREASRRAHGPQSATRSFDKVALTLGVVSAIPFALLLGFSDDLFAFMLGQTWREAGVLAAAISPLLWVRFIASPLSSVFLIYKRQRELLLWQLMLLAITLSGFYLAHRDNWTPRHLLAVQSIALACIYGVLLLRARLIVRRADKATDR